MKTMLAAAMVGLLALPLAGEAQTCAGHPARSIGGVQNSWALDGGGLAAFAKMNINLDGYGHAYHPSNFASGALIHLCNAGKVYLPDGSSFQGSENNATCTGRFMDAFKRVGQAGWKDPTVGAINWFGILGRGSATIHGRQVQDVMPVTQKDGSGFFVSPTSFFDASVTDPADQARYINPLRVPAAVIPGSLASQGIRMGTFGVAIDTREKIAVPFVVGDGGPRIGEGSAALARLVAGQPLTDDVTHQTRGVGQVDTPSVLWVFFGGQPTTYDHNQEGKLADDAEQAFTRWGSQARLQQCLAVVPKN